MKDRPFQLTDVVRETGFAIHCFFGPGHLERVYQNSLVHRLRKHGLTVHEQQRLTVFDCDGVVVGEFQADIVVEGVLLVEVKAARSIADEHIAQLLGYLRSARIEHGVLVNFGAGRFQIRKMAMSEGLRRQDGRPAVD